MPPEVHLALDYAKTFLKDLVLPPSGLLLLALFGLFWLQRRPRVARVLLVLSLSLLWLLSTGLVADQLARWGERYGPLDAARDPHAGAIVVLGGGGQRDYAPEYAGPAADPLLLERLAYGAFLARRLQLPLLVTGFRIEAEAMSDSLQRNFSVVPRWVDATSYDTFDNARNSARLLATAGVRRIVLVTNEQHMWRAVHEFGATGLNVLPAPVGLMPPRRSPITPLALVPDSTALSQSSAVIYELLGERVRVLLAVTGLRRQQPVTH
jgi:uncharacterized SAM-binding protein YcdF (DUF218 family)